MVQFKLESPNLLIPTKKWSFAELLNRYVIEEFL